MTPFTHRRPALAPSLLALAAVLALACDATGPDGPRRLSVSVMVPPAAGTLSGATPGINADVVVGSGPNSLVITKVEFVLSEMELSQSGACTTPPEDDDDCEELELDPILVDLPLDVAPPAKVLDAFVPAGTYASLEAALSAVDAGEDEGGAAAFLAAHPDWAGVSVRVVGVYTDAAGAPHDFTYTSAVHAGIEMEFAQPVLVDATSQNLTIVVDVASWFTDDAGAAIDPTNSANAAQIDANIRRSFRAFSDDDENGVDDEHENGDDGDDGSDDDAPPAP